MARYFFHTDNGVERRDAEGVELSTDQPAHLAAALFLGELLVDSPEEFWTSQSLTVTVTNGAGRVELVLNARVLGEP
jgi:hypothetical protein